MSDECDTNSYSSVQNCTRNDSFLYRVSEDEDDWLSDCEAWDKFEDDWEGCEKYLEERDADREAKTEAKLEANREIYNKRDGDYFGKYIKMKFVNRDQAFY